MGKTTNRFVIGSPCRRSVRRSAPAAQVPTAAGAQVQGKHSRRDCSASTHIYIKGRAGFYGSDQTVASASRSAHSTGPQTRSHARDPRPRDDGGSERERREDLTVRPRRRPCSLLYCIVRPLRPNTRPINERGTNEDSAAPQTRSQSDGRGAQPLPPLVHSFAAVAGRTCAMANEEGYPDGTGGRRAGVERGVDRSRPARRWPDRACGCSSRAGGPLSPDYGC